MNRGTYFLERRKALHMTQAHLALAAGVDERTVRKLEKNEPVADETLRAVAAVLEIDLGIFVEPERASGGVDVDAILRHLRASERPGPEEEMDTPSDHPFDRIATYAVRAHVVFLQVAMATCVAALAISPSQVSVIGIFMALGTIAFARVVVATTPDYSENVRRPGSRRVPALFLTFGVAFLVALGLAQTLTMDDGTWLRDDPGIGAILYVSLFSAMAVVSAVAGTIVLFLARGEGGRTYLCAFVRSLGPRRLLRSARRHVVGLNAPFDLR